MAIVFQGLGSDAGLKKLDEYLLTRSYITGYQASKDDLVVHAALSKAPSAEYVNASRWYNHIEALLRISGVSGEGSGVTIKSSLAAEETATPPATEAKAAPAEEDDDDDDDVDLFGEETEEEKKAAEERAAAIKASGKKKEAGKSSVLMDVKPWDDETDMKKLEEAVRSVHLEGLTWGASKLQPVGYGIKKMTIMLTIVDDLVSVDNMIEDYLTAEPINEYVQSCDIVAFNKICSFESAPIMKSKKATTTGDAHEFEFCKVCNRHHQDGSRHKYFPKHLSSLSSFLSRFQSKLSDVRFFLKNPTSLLPQHASRNRLWCVFCEIDLHETGSSFACSNAIRHLASAPHLKCLKNFLWKNGGVMDQVDSFVIPESELEKWKSKCDLLQKGSVYAAGKASNGSVATYGPSNDIHNQNDVLAVNSVDHYTMSTHEFHSSFDVVMPLHRYTNENYQVWTSQGDQTATFDPGHHQNGFSYVFQPVPLSGSSSSGLMHNSASQEAAGNVHTGAPPPWLDPISNQDTMVQGSDVDLVKPCSEKSSKSRKLNPKRVGAAWAENRKIEIEMEKRGEICAEKADDCWLPNFGRVWQTGSRKVSKKEFELEKQKVSEVFSQSEMPMEIRPYVSKKRRTEGTSTS